MHEIQVHMSCIAHEGMGQWPYEGGMGESVCPY